MKTNDLQLYSSEFYTPTQKQAIFHHTQELVVPEVLYGGAAGGGKSMALVMDALKYGLRYPHANMLLVRRTKGELESSITRKILQFYPNTLYNYNKTQGQVTLTNKTVIHLGYLGNANHVYRYQGAEFSYVAFDELTHFYEDEYLFLFSRLRNTTGYPNLMRATANPVPYKAWVKDRFITTTDEHDNNNNDNNNVHGVAKILTLEQLKKLAVHSNSNTTSHTDKLYIPSMVYDNPHINIEEYVRNLEKLPLKVRNAMLNGDWSIPDGTLFAVDMFKISKGVQLDELTKYIAVDIALKDGASAAKNDRTAIVVIGVDKGNTAHMLDVSAGHYSATQSQNILLEMIRNHKPIQVGIERTTASWHYYDMFRNLMLNSAVFVPLVELTPSGRGKNLRIELFLLKALEEGRLLFYEQVPKLVLEEALRFDPTSKNNGDDILDALAYALEMGLSHVPQWDEWGDEVVSAGWSNGSAPIDTDGSW